MWEGHVKGGTTEGKEPFGFGGRVACRKKIIAPTGTGGLKKKKHEDERSGARNDVKALLNLEGGPKEEKPSAP